MAEPTTEEIRRTLAKFMGWEQIYEASFPDHGDDLWGVNVGLDVGAIDIIPDYLSDLDAMHEVEERICASERSVEYARALCLHARASHVNLISSWGPLWPYIHATPEQRARAAYHVIKEYFNG